MIDQEASPYSPPRANLEGGAAQAGVLPLASAGSRLAAVFIDGLLFAPAVIVGGVISYLGRPAPGQPPTTMATGGLAVMALLGIYFIAVAIYQIMLLSTRGQTVGKRAMKIRIVKLDGSPPGFVHAVLLRAIVNAIPSAIPFVGGLYALVDILFIFRGDKRCIHDHIASTRVVMADGTAVGAAIPAV